MCPENHPHIQLDSGTAKYPTAPTIKGHVQIPSSVEKPGIDWCPSVIRLLNKIPKQGWGRSHRVSHPLREWKGVEGRIECMWGVTRNGGSEWSVEWIRK